MGKTAEHGPNPRQEALGEVGRMGLMGGNLWHIGADKDVVARSQIPDALNQDPQPHTQESIVTPSVKPSRLSRLRTAVTVFFNSEDGLPHKGTSVIDLVLADERTLSTWHLAKEPTQAPTTVQLPKYEPKFKLNEGVSELLIESSSADADFKYDLTIKAATRAMAVASVDTNPDSKGLHAMIAIENLLDVGEQVEAIEFAQAILADPSVSNLYKDAIRKELSIRQV